VFLNTTNKGKKRKSKGIVGIKSEVCAREGERKHSREEEGKPREKKEHF
jgi:hypothetical protein